ncbi:hypothetical protein TNCV_305761 [Trichonephila clavipes]|nr:hypothetical protein TNCV_305761 [Trichonephila clavipes]
MGCLSFRVACWAASNFIANTRAPFKSLRSAIRRAFWISGSRTPSMKCCSARTSLTSVGQSETPSESLSTSVASFEFYNLWRTVLAKNKIVLDPTSDTNCCVFGVRND